MAELMGTQEVHFWVAQQESVECAKYLVSKHVLTQITITIAMKQ
jgi:hypothetical protein